MSFLAAGLGLATSVLGGVLQNEAADKAADAQVDASKRAIDEQRRQFDIATQLTAPARYYGDQAQALLGMGYGITPYSDTQPQGPAAQFTGANSQADPRLVAANQYLSANPDVQRAYQSNQMNARGIFPNVADFADYHYNTYGRSEGRSFGNPAPAVGSGGASNGLTIDLVNLGDGRYGPGPGGAQVLTNGPSGQPSPEDLQQQAYDRFQGSGEARSMLETTQNDFDQMIGAYGAGGKAMSGSTLGALNDRNRRNTNAAFQQYSNGLRSMSGAGQVATQQQAQSAIELGNSVAGQLNFQGGVRGSSYAQQSANTLGAISNGLGSISNKDFAQMGQAIGGFFG